MKIIKIALISGILWVGFSSNGGSFSLPHFGPDSAFAGKNGNGGSNGRGNSGRSNSGNSKNNNSTIGSAASGEEKSPNLSSELKGLNSLNRNINGLLNSSDPKMEAFADLVLEMVETEGEPTDADLLEAMQAAFGEPPATEWSDDAISWVNERVTDLIAAKKDLDANPVIPEGP